MPILYNGSVPVEAPTPVSVFRLEWGKSKCHHLLSPLNATDTDLISPTVLLRRHGVGSLSRRSTGHGSIIALAVRGSAVTQRAGILAANGVLVCLSALLVISRKGMAHVGGFGGAGDTGEIPFLLIVLTGGGVVGASFMLTTLLTDHSTIRSVNALGVSIPIPGYRGLAGVTSGLGVVALVVVVLNGLLGSQNSTSNLAILLVWVVWWAGYTMSVYLLGNTWPVLSPWRTLAKVLPNSDRPLPGTAGWAGVAGLLALVWLEVVSPVSENPRLLAFIVGGYTAVTLLGAAYYGGEWFDRIDPIDRVFGWYGRMGVFRRGCTGISVGVPGSALIGQPRVSSPDEEAGRPVANGAMEHRGVALADTDHRTGFVVGLLWVTTYDGLVSTPAWRAVVEPLVEGGLPAPVVYLAAILGGYALFLSAYRLAATLSRRTGHTFVTADFIRRRFVPSLIPIAVGYHLAHFGGYFLSLLPTIGAVLANPLSPPDEIVRLVLPGWFGALKLTFIVLGHMLAVWVAHAIAFETFTGRLQPIRSQYPFILVMVFYTMTSMWIVAQPYTPPPYV